MLTIYTMNHLQKTNDLLAKYSSEFEQDTVDSGLMSLGFPPVNPRGEQLGSKSFSSAEVQLAITQMDSQTRRRLNANLEELLD